VRKARPPIADDVVDEDAEAIKDRVENDAAIIVVLFTETTRLLLFVCLAVSVPSVCGHLNTVLISLVFFLKYFFTFLVLPTDTPVRKSRWEKEAQI